MNLVHLSTMTQFPAFHCNLDELYINRHFRTLTIHTVSAGKARVLHGLYSGRKYQTQNYWYCTSTNLQHYPYFTVCIFSGCCIKMVDDDDVALRNANINWLYFLCACQYKALVKCWLNAFSGILTAENIHAQALAVYPLCHNSRNNKRVCHIKASFIRHLTASRVCGDY